MSGDRPSPSGRQPSTAGRQRPTASDPPLPRGISDELIVDCAAPRQVRVALARLADAQPDAMATLVSADDARSGPGLVAVLAASRFLTRVLETDPRAWAVLVDLDERLPAPSASLDAAARAAPAEAGPDALAAWKQRELLRLCARDLLGLDPLEATGKGLAALGREVLVGCVDRVAPEVLDPDDSLAVIGMGKLGGDELNYASDVDVMFVGDGDPRRLDRAAQRVMELARHCFRIDADLRPEGRNGTLVRTLDSYEAYWDRWARPWEFQALLKARPAAGDPGLGARFSDAAQRWLWNQPWRTDDLRELRHLKERAEHAAAKRGRADREIKRGPGGIRDIEFTAQLLQLVHGQHDSALRSPTTLTVLVELGQAGYIAGDDAVTLTEAYLFLRDTEHRLQLVDEQQVHRVPDNPAAREHLARTLGVRATRADSALEVFDARLRAVQLGVRSVHERVYFRPLLEAFAGSDGRLSEAAAEARLAAFGFTDARRTKAAVRELTRGLNRSSRLMGQMLPLLLDWLSDAPDPDLGLLVLRNLLSGPQRSTPLLEAFRDSPEVARQLCVVVGTSRVMGDALGRNPDLVARLPHPDQLATQPREDLVASARERIGWRDDASRRQEALLRWKERHLLGIQARDLLWQEPVAAVGTNLSAVAEATIDAALDTIDHEVPFAVLALGRLGGASLSYASDLDLVFAYRGEGGDAFAEADRVAKALLRILNGGSPAERLYEVDLKLRPEGAGGAMARTPDGFAAYFARWAQVWERQAYLRARPVAGDVELGRSVLDALAPHVWEAGLNEAQAVEIRRMKARVETERMPANEDPTYHLKLGRGSLTDIEWTAQMLQLRFGLRATSTVDALAVARDHGHLTADQAATLIETYEFLERTRNRLFLVGSTSGDALPTQPEPLMWLARSLDANAAELREHYRRVTRRARRVVEQVFYA